MHQLKTPIHQVFQHKNESKDWLEGRLEKERVAPAITQEDMDDLASRFGASARIV